MQFIVQGYPAYAYTGGRPFEPRAPAIVFIHGAAFDHSVWQWQSRSFAHHGFSVLAPDLPAHGRSPGDARVSIGDMADWVAALLEAACLPSAHVVGHSMGSLVALDVALRHRARVASLTLIGCAIPMAVGEAFLAAAKDNDAAGYDMEVVWGHARHVQLAASPAPGIALSGASRALNGRARDGVLHTDLAACNAYRPDPAAVRALELRTLILGGMRDQMTPMKGAQALAKDIPGVRLVALDAGHSMMAEAPVEVTGALRAFFAG